MRASLTQIVWPENSANIQNCDKHKLAAGRARTAEHTSACFRFSDHGLRTTPMPPPGLLIQFHLGIRRPSLKS